MDEPRYIEPTAASRLKLAGSTLAVILCGVAYDHWITPQVRKIGAMSTCESLPWVRLEVAVVLLSCWLMAWVLLGLGRETHTLGQTPLPRAWVWRRTQVRTGLYARFTAWSLFAFSALLWAGPVFVFFWQKLYVIFCFPQA